MLTWQNTGDPCTPETLTMVNGLVPTRIGYTAGDLPTAFSSSNTEITETTGLGYTPRGLSYFDTSGDQQLIFTIANKIYRYPGNADISRGVAYTNGAFSFAQYREYIYACNGADLLQKSSTGAFADVASTPKLTRICAWGERLFGINNVASFTSGGTPYAASNYRYWISGIGNPEQFDAAIDSTAYTDDIKDDGGPLVACAVLRDFVVVLKKSGVYVIEDTGGPIFAERKVSDYYGCEWPDSVIVVNNIMYWISPTRGGEVVAFDGTQITALSGALKNVVIAQGSTSDYGFTTTTNARMKRGGLVASTNGENIYWTRFYFTDGANEFNGLGTTTTILSLNIVTGRFGYQATGITNDISLMVFSNAAQSGFLAIIVTNYEAGNNKFKVAYLQQSTSLAGKAEFFRSSKEKAKVTGVVLTFSETIDPVALNSSTPMSLSMGFMPIATASSYPAIVGTPTLSIMSSQVSGEAVNKTESTALTLNTGTWNANTFQFDVSQNGSRSISAKSFAFAIGNLNPKTSLIGITVKAEVAGTSQAGGKSVQWQ